MIILLIQVLHQIFRKINWFSQVWTRKLYDADTSGIFRPIGIVVLIVDWGCVIFIAIVLQYLNALFNF